MRIMGYNVCMSEEPGHLFADRAAGLRTLVEKYDPDVIGLQEVTPPWLKLLEEHFGETYEIFNKYRASNNFEGTPMLWKKEKYECLDKGYFWLSDTPDIESQGWDTYRCNRICLWAKLRDRATGEAFVHFNTHFGFSDLCHVESTRLICAHIREMKLPAFITADFNFAPGSAGYREMTSRLGDVDADTVQNEDPTYNGYQLKLDWGGSRIDFCFYTRDSIVPLDYRRLDERPNGQFISDHYGTLYDVKILAKFSAATFDTGAGDPDLIYASVRDSLPDIMGFQRAKPEYFERFGRSRHWEHTEGGTPVFWRPEVFEAAEEERFDLPGADAACTVVTLKKRYTGQKILCFNTRLSADPADQLKSVALLRAKREAYPELPALFLGGFAAEIGSEPYRAMRAFCRDVRAEIAPENTDYTEMGPEPGTSAPRITDFIFASGDCLTPRSYQVLSGVAKGKRSSDHRPLLVQFSID